MTRDDILQTRVSQLSHTRPRPGRRRHNSYRIRFNFVHTLALFLLVPYPLCGFVHAADAGARPFRTQEIPGRFGRRDLILDGRPVPEPAIHPRVEASSIPAPAATDTANDPSTSSTTSSDSTPTSIESAPTGSASFLPTPFDGGFGKNYTQPSCPIFLKNMINNNTIISCLPFSLLLQVSHSPFYHQYSHSPNLHHPQNSMSFFSAAKTLSHITATLNTSCNIDFHTCSSTISSYASTLRSSNGCAQDYERQQPLVRQAYAGLLSYDVLYAASCTKTRATTSEPTNNGSYCFANAITNLSSPTDSYIYYLPLGIPLPADSMPTCNTCLKDVMDIFAAAAPNKTQPLSANYVNAAQQIDRGCGPGFVNETVAKTGSGQSSSAPLRVHGLGWGLFVVLLSFVFSGL